MSRRKSISRTAGIVASAFITVGALVFDVAGVFTDVAWQWWALGGFVIFAGLMGWRVHDQNLELADLKANQDFELALRRVSEHGKRLRMPKRTAAPKDLVLAVEEIRVWLSEAETVLVDPKYLSHFRGGTEGTFTEIDDVKAQYLGDGFTSDSTSAVGTDRFNHFIDLRLHRIGEILFSLPGPASKVMRLG